MEKEELDKWLADAEKRITDNVTKAIDEKKDEKTSEQHLKDMEKRILEAVNKKLSEVSPPEKSVVSKTFESIETRLQGLDGKITTLKTYADALRTAGESVSQLEERIAELEKMKTELSDSIVRGVEGAVKKKMVDFDKRLSDIENVPDRTIPSSIQGGVVVRGFGLGDMLDEATRSVE